LRPSAFNFALYSMHATHVTPLLYAGDDFSIGPAPPACRTVTVYLVAAARLVWVFHDVEIGPILRAVRGVRWIWIALAVDILSYITQALDGESCSGPSAIWGWLDATQAIRTG
jgi:hypothetical protein